MTGDPGAPGPAAPPRPRASGLLLASLALSAISLALPVGLGPLGPLVAGLLAFLGWRGVRASRGALRGPVLAKVAMTLALALFAAEAWGMVRHAPTAAAWAGVRGQVSLVDANLRSGTPEGAWDLLSPEARKGLDRGRFAEEVRAAMATLGALRSLGEAREAGGDWQRTGTFEDGGAADLRLGLEFDAAFEHGPGRVAVEVRVRRTGDVVESGIESLHVTPGAGGELRTPR